MQWGGEMLSGGKKHSDGSKHSLQQPSQGCWRWRDHWYVAQHSNTEVPVQVGNTLCTLVNEAAVV